MSFDIPEDFDLLFREQLLQYPLQFLKENIGIATDGKVSLLLSLPLFQQLSSLVFAAISSLWCSFHNSKII